MKSKDKKCPVCGGLISKSEPSKKLCAQCRSKHREKGMFRAKQWRLNNPEKVKAYYLKRKELKKQNAEREHEEYE